MIVWWTAVAWLSGSCMFSYWLGRLARTNLKAFGDGNPGALNLWLAAGYKFGIAGIVLDFLKGYVPVLLVMDYGLVEGYGIVPVALAPIVGHAFSPFLRFKGGKAIAVTFGVWSALTRFEVSLIYAIILALLLLLGRALNNGKPVSTSADGFQVVCGMLFVSVYLYTRGFPSAILWFWLGNLLLLAYTHRRELSAFVMRST
ncbi:glycerol-3-phosphate acyltransferase [Cohnella silvisoli]|uniref:Glycerol-3-phosphate acyltransferase n=1 Tax=Cohnella silvisoli TaxID=2873699 RepID=A0ABV1KPJ0_9BACL|nr:glycerol-3-phosphate acyltransferase [Cohnella silvisoli]MCD9020275.1 glycerol-3-phosphate acyltransferase [Cohnella silvisoli]